MWIDFSSWARVAGVVLALVGTLPPCYAQPKMPVQPKPAAPPGPTLKTYQGEYQGGTATYTYYLGGDGRRVRHGKFEQKKSTYGAGYIGRRVIIGNATEYRTAGAYAHGKKTGPWSRTETDYDNQNRVANRRTTTETYVNDAVNGPATYADVPWQAGKPGSPTVSASARRRTRPQRRTVAVPPRAMDDPDVDDEHPLTEDEEIGLDSERDTTVEVTEFAAGPYRYTERERYGAPAGQAQTASGYFDADGLCDSTWTLHYRKGRSELNDATAVQAAGGWMTTVLDFAHGVLRSERTTQASTGEVISRFVLPATYPQDTASRLVLTGKPAHWHNYSEGAPETPEADWASPIPDDENASDDFFFDATRPLGLPLLQNISYKLVPTAADTALLLLAENVLKQARTQFPDSVFGYNRRALPETFGSHPSLGLLREELYRLVAANEADETAATGTGRLARFWASGDDRRNRSQEPRPWLRQLTDEGEDHGYYHGPALELMQGRQHNYLTHLGNLRLRTRQLQARLTGTAATPAKP